MDFRYGLLIFAFLSSASCSPVNLKDERKPFTIEEAVLGQFSVKSFSGRWISDTDIEYLDKITKEVKVLNVPTNKTQIVLKGSVLGKYNTTDYEFSNDRSLVLISYDEEGVYRHSKTSRYVVYSVKDGTYYDIAKKERLQIVKWSPKSSVLVYIKDNNIYYLPKIGDKVEAKQITNNGDPGVIFNGISDWVYEEEILGSSEAFWFSPEGDQIVFLTFNDTDVGKALIPEYGEPRNFKNQYTGQVKVRYPKAGSTIPQYELWHVNLNNPCKKSLITKSAPGLEVFYDLEWVFNDFIVFVQTNRVQNESKFYSNNVTQPDSKKLLFQYNNPKGWANVKLPFTNPKKSASVRIEGVPVGKAGNFNHLVYYSKNSSYPLTGGYFDVLSVIYWDDKKHVVYYSATEEYNSTTTQVYAVSESKGSKPACLTCRIKSPEGRGCKDASISFSKNGTYAVVNCKGPDPRMVYLFKNVHPYEKPLAILEDNAKLRADLKKKLLPDVMNMTVEVPGSLKADVRLMLPPNMDRSGKTKYPLLIYVYAGPGSKGILDAFKMDWGLYMSTNLSVIYGFIDGRNTLRKGENMLFAGYKALGTYEMEDQMNVTRYLQKTLPFVDSTRTAIWGWSYGGYATTKILELDTQNIFKCGIAVAPVADWMYYDSMYTERYMLTPQENKNGYEKSSVLKDVSNLRNKKYFLIHGNADDNVHYQNAMMIAKLLEKEAIPFELMSYPDEDHSLQHVRKHLYYTMDGFWKKCFNLSKTA